MTESAARITAAAWPRAMTWPALSCGALVVLVVLIVAAALHAGVGVGRIAMLLVIAPLAEEALLRAGLHEEMLKRATPPWLANLIAALAFALAHALLRGQATALLLALPALLVGAAYQRTRLVHHCVLLHAALNLIWLTAGLVDMLPAFAH